MRRSIILFGLMLAVVGTVNAQATVPSSCPVCHHLSSVTNAGSIRDDETQPSRNLSVWNRSICGNLAHPSNSAVCTNCWYGHNVLVDKWELARETTDGFAKPLRKEIASFPVPGKAAITSRLVYSQELSPDAIVDRVAFWTKSDTAYEKTITVYAQTNGVGLEVNKHPERKEMYVCGGVRTRIKAPNKAPEDTARKLADPQR